jgi:hypothetical protein
VRHAEIYHWNTSSGCVSGQLETALSRCSAQLADLRSFSLHIQIVSDWDNQKAAHEASLVSKIDARSGVKGVLHIRRSPRNLLTRTWTWRERSGAKFRLAKLEEDSNKENMVQMMAASRRMIMGRITSLGVGELGK